MENQLKRLYDMQKQLLENIEQIDKNFYPTEYQTLNKQLVKTNKKIVELEDDLALHKYESCNHVWVCIGNSDSNGINYSEYGCVKCGLDTREFLSDRHMQHYFKTNRPYITRNIPYCEFALAKEVYNLLEYDYPRINYDVILDIYDDQKVTLPLISYFYEKLEKYSNDNLKVPKKLCKNKHKI